jgi:hypothetical protein
MPTTAELQVYLTEAEAAYRAVVTGGAIIEVRDSSGESVRYSPANASRLKAYIAELKAQLLGKTPTPHRVMRPTWG